MGWPCADAHSVQREYWACVPGSLPGHSLFPSVKRRLLGCKCLGIDLPAQLWTWASPFGHSRLPSQFLHLSIVQGQVTLTWVLWLAQCLQGCVGGADPGEEGQAAALPSCS